MRFVLACQVLVGVGGGNQYDRVKAGGIEGDHRRREQNEDHRGERKRADDQMSMEYYEFVRKALTEHPDVDGVFASSDVIGAHVLQVCSHLGIKVPEELKIVGFDDVNIAQLTSPGLTSIHQPIEQMAEMAVLTISQIDMGKMMPSKTVFPVTLVERGTT